MFCKGLHTEYIQGKSSQPDPLSKFWSNMRFVFVLCLTLTKITVQTLFDPNKDYKLCDMALKYSLSKLGYWKV